MKWEITNNRPTLGDVRYRTRFAFLPTRVLSKITMTDHIIWLHFYLEEQEYRSISSWGEPDDYGWRTVAKTIHI